MADMENKEPKYLDENLIDEVPSPEHPDPEAEKKAADEKAAADLKAAEEAKVAEEAKKPESQPDPKFMELESKLAEANAKIAELAKRPAEPKAEAPIKSMREQFLEKFSTDPAGAFLDFHDQEKLANFMDQDLNHTKTVMEQAVQGRIPGWEDFSTLAPIIQASAESLQHFVKPEMGGNIRLVEELAWAARGRLAYAKEQNAKKEADTKAAADAKAAEEAAKVAEQEKQKQEVFMESSSSGVGTGNGEISLEEFRKLPLSEMEKIYPYVEQ